MSPVAYGVFETVGGVQCYDLKSETERKAARRSVTDAFREHAMQ